MLILDTTTALVRLVTSSTADIEVQASYVDFDTPDTFTSAGQNTIITSAATTTVVASPGSASLRRNVTGLTIKNEHASTANTITVEHTDGTTVVTLFKATLAAGEQMTMNEAGTWFVYDTNGGVKMGASAASDTLAGLIALATQADMESASSLLLAVTPGRAQYHPGVAKFWVKTTPGGVNAASYNVTSVADAAAGITVVTIATDFSSASWCCQCACESTSDTMTVTNLKFVRIGLADQAAGTVSIEVHDATAITAVLEDPTSWQVAGWGDQ